MRAGVLELFVRILARRHDVVLDYMRLEVNVIVQRPDVFVERGRLGHLGEDIAVLDDDDLVDGPVRRERERQVLHVEGKVVELELLEERALNALDHVDLDERLPLFRVVELLQIVLDVFLFEVTNRIVHIQLRIPQRAQIACERFLLLVILIFVVFVIVVVVVVVVVAVVANGVLVAINGIVLTVVFANVADIVVVERQCLFCIFPIRGS